MTYGLTRSAGTGLLYSSTHMTTVDVKRLNIAPVVRCVDDIMWTGTGRVVYLLSPVYPINSKVNDPLLSSYIISYDP